MMDYAFNVEEVDTLGYEYYISKVKMISRIYWDLKTIDELQKFSDRSIEELARQVFEKMKEYAEEEEEEEEEY